MQKEEIIKRKKGKKEHKNTKKQIKLRRLRQLNKKSVAKHKYKGGTLKSHPSRKKIMNKKWTAR